jgi:hypothetical protein
VDAFTSSDPLPPGPLPYADITNPQSLNKYTYTYNNPLNYVDPNGHAPCPPACTLSDIQVYIHIGEMAAEQAPKAAAAATSLLLKVVSVAGYALSVGAEPVGVGSSLDDHPEIKQQQEEKRKLEEERKEGPEPEPSSEGAGARSGGGRNDRKINVKRADAAKATLNDLVKKRDELRSKANKTPEDKKELEKIERQIQRQRDRMKKSESHSQKSKKPQAH